MKKLVVLVLSVLLAGAASAAVLDLTAWQTQAAATTGNVVADATGWTFDGTSGVAFDYGALDAIGGKPVDGSTIEYILNAQDAATVSCLGFFYSWSPGGERIEFKLEQWNNTGKFGLTTPGAWDKTLATDSVFDEDVHVVLRRNNNSGTMDLFVNGAYMETEATKTNWRMDGGTGFLGAGRAIDRDVMTGTIYAVGTYDVALTDQQIADLAVAVGIPEPATMVLLGLGSLLAVRRKK